MDIEDQQEREALEQEIDDLTNCWQVAEIHGEHVEKSLEEYREIVRLQAEFIGEHHQSHEFQEFFISRKSRPSSESKTKSEPR